MSTLETVLIPSSSLLEVEIILTSLVEVCLPASWSTHRAFVLGGDVGSVIILGVGDLAVSPTGSSWLQGQLFPLKNIPEDSSSLPPAKVFPFIELIVEVSSSSVEDSGFLNVVSISLA